MQVNHVVSVLQSEMQTCYLCFRVEPCVAESPYGCFVMHPGLGMDYIQDLGVGEM